MLESLTRIVADRSVGAAFFGNYYLMDFELMGGDARQAIIDESAGKRGMTPFSASGRAVWFKSVADPHHAGQRAGIARRSCGRKVTEVPRVRSLEALGEMNALMRTLIASCLRLRLIPLHFVEPVVQGEHQRCRY